MTKMNEGWLMMSTNQHQRQPAQVQNENAYTSMSICLQILDHDPPSRRLYGPKTISPSSPINDSPSSLEISPLILVDLWGCLSREAAPSVQVTGKMEGLTNSGDCWLLRRPHCSSIRTRAWMQREWWKVYYHKQPRCTNQPTRP